MVYFQYRINSSLVVDQPRFPHRGFMVDSSRHFLSKTAILQVYTNLFENKLRVYCGNIACCLSDPRPDGDEQAERVPLAPHRRRVLPLPKQGVPGNEVKINYATHNFPPISLILLHIYESRSTVRIT